jgi:hypothetical protein
MSERKVLELRVKRYSPNTIGDYLNGGSLEASADGEFVKAEDVRTSIRKMIASGRLSPDTAKRLIEQLGLQ